MSESDWDSIEGECNEVLGELERQKKDPTRIFSETFGAIIKGQQLVATFRRMANWGKPSARGSAREAAEVEAHDVLDAASGDFPWMDIEALSNVVGSARGFATSIFENRLSDFDTAVDLASLFLAQAVLDDASRWFLRVTALRSPESWEPVLSDETVKLGDLKSRSYEELRETAALKRAESAGGQAIPRRVDRLLAICKPVSGRECFKGYSYDRERLTKLVDIRNQAAHGVLDSPALPNGEEDIAFLFRTSLYLAILVSERFQISVSPAALGRGH